jgi:FKBP-type peptidyl-prolyl cis-trans isomerase FkpA
LKPYNILLASLLVLMLSCNTETKKEAPLPSEQQIKKPLESVNKYLVKTEDEEINDFIARYNWKMTKTSTGLRYMIYKNGNGVKAEQGKLAKINFELRLINGTLSYSSKQEGTKEFEIGKSNAESGLQEGILLMRVGDKAKLIIPSHLAYGLHGDENKIPKRATLVYDVELLQVRNKE